MSNTLERPNFTQNTTGTGFVNGTEDGTVVNTKLAEVIEKRKGRPECGASWRRVSKTNMEYYTLRLKFTTERFQELLTQVNSDGVIEVNLVAFPNKNSDGNDRRPAFRIYEELNS